ncbi:hypothetical protein [Microbacterium neungamense]|uniref:hypothetical protein n=1 Tax=Microbacterium neungamense TaxID=2810535 RepID=UPI00217D0103|nr:hypothetical protein [Microbacterium neungamense]UWF77134.1 hypothetical protein JSY13_10095 [Microbacterium neungamense]
MSSAVQVRKERLTLERANRMLRSRADLIDRGRTDAWIAAGVASGVLVRVRRGHYAPAASWGRLWPEGRHLLRVLAVHRDAVAPPIFCGASAAVIHGFPLYRHEPARVHVAIPQPGHAGSSSDVLRHRLDLSDEDVVEVAGMRVTSPLCTVFDVSRVLSTEAAQSIADAGLRRFAVTGHRRTRTSPGSGTTTCSAASAMRTGRRARSGAGRSRRSPTGGPSCPARA